jgi:hypothetical protein
MVTGALGPCLHANFQLRRLGLRFPGQFLKRRIVALASVALFRQIYFIAIVVPEAGAVLSAPAVSLSVNSARHRARAYFECELQ